MSVLFKHATVLLRKENGYEALKDAFLGVSGKTIDYIGKEMPHKTYETVKDATDLLLMPGLVNAHTHIPMVFMRGIAEGLPLQNWLYDRVFPTEAKLTKEIIRASSYYAILELLASGVTSFTDMYFFSEETAEAVIQSGIKANLNKYLLCFDPNQSIEDGMIPASLEYIRTYDNAAEGRLKADFSIHAEYTNQPHIVREYSRLCKEYGGRMHIHLSESRKEVEECIERYGKTPVEWFEEMGTFDSPTLAAHVVWPMKNDLKILKRHNVSVAHCPSSNMSIGSGFAPVRKMLDLGINVCLGTDGTASNNNLNMMEEMHLASVIHNGFHLDATKLYNHQVLDMATRNGALSQGRENTGILEVGRDADIIAVSLKGVHMYPILDYEAILTKSAQASDVVMTMVDGRILYENGEYLTLDREKITAEFREEVEKFY